MNINKPVKSKYKKVKFQILPLKISNFNDNIIIIY